MKWPTKKKLLNILSGEFWVESFPLGTILSRGFRCKLLKHKNILSLINKQSMSCRFVNMHFLWIKRINAFSVPVTKSHGKTFDAITFLSAKNSHHNTIRLYSTSHFVYIFFVFTSQYIDNARIPLLNTFTQRKHTKHTSFICFQSTTHSVHTYIPAAAVFAHLVVHLYSYRIFAA